MDHEEVDVDSTRICADWAGFYRGLGELRAIGAWCLFMFFCGGSDGSYGGFSQQKMMSNASDCS